MKWKELVLLTVFGLGGCIESESDSSYETTEEVEPNNIIEASQLVKLDNSGYVANGHIAGEVGEGLDTRDYYQFTLQKPTGMYRIAVSDPELPFHNPVLISIYKGEKLIHTGSTTSGTFNFNLLLYKYGTYTVEVSSQQDTNYYVITIEHNGIELKEGRHDWASRYFQREDVTWAYKNDPNNPSLCLQGGFHSAEEADVFVITSDYQLGKCEENRGSDLLGFCGIKDFSTREPQKPLISGADVEKLYFALPMEMEEATVMCADLKGSFFHTNLMNRY